MSRYLGDLGVIEIRNAAPAILKELLTRRKQVAVARAGFRRIEMTGTSEIAECFHDIAHSYIAELDALEKLETEGK